MLGLFSNEIAIYQKKKNIIWSFFCSKQNYGEKEGRWGKVGIGYKKAADP